eukprot:g5158.t1
MSRINSFAILSGCIFLLLWFYFFKTSHIDNVEEGLRLRGVVIPTKSYSFVDKQRDMNSSFSSDAQSLFRLFYMQKQMPFLSGIKHQASIQPAKSFKIFIDFETSQRLSEHIPYLQPKRLPVVKCAKSIFGAEILLPRMLAQSEYSTTSRGDADFVLVPIYSTCAWTTFGPKASGDKLLRKVVDYLQTNDVTYRKYGGRNHVFILAHDFGPCFADMRNPDRKDNPYPVSELRNSVLLLTNGHIGSACFNSFKDIVLPPAAVFLSDEKEERKSNTTDKKILAFFAGHRWWPKFGPGKPKCSGERKDDDYTPCFDEFYSRGIRDKIFELYKGDDEVVLKGATENDRLSPSEFTVSMENAEFCLCILGYALWSPRLAEAIAANCIPVIIADGIELPFEGTINYRKFVVKLSQEEVLAPPSSRNSLKQILKSILPQKRKHMRSYIKKVAPLFRYPHLEDVLIPKIQKKYKKIIDVVAYELWQKRREKPVAFDSFA